MASRLIVAVLVSLFFALPLAAQTAPSPKQVELNRQAFAAMKSGDIDAVRRRRLQRIDFALRILGTRIDKNPRARRRAQ